MPINLFHVFHVTCVILLVSINFFAFAAPLPERRKAILKYSGIASFFVLLSGFGLHGMLHIGWPLWFVVKLICWFIISGLAGMAFRFPGKIRDLTIATIVLALIAATMVYVRPF